MPISASAKKSLRVAERQAQENRGIKIRLKNQLKRTTPETAALTFSLLDKAAKRHVIHKNKAARLKSRLAKSLAQTPVEAPKKTAARKRTSTK